MGEFKIYFVPDFTVDTIPKTKPIFAKVVEVENFRN